MSLPLLFEKLRHDVRTAPRLGAAPEVYFQLAFDDAGAYLAVVDAKGRPVEAFDPRLYESDKRDLLRLVAALRDEALFRVSWGERPEDRLYLADHDLLPPLLLRAGGLVDAAMQPLRRAESMAHPVVMIAPEDAAGEEEGEEADVFTADRLRSRVRLRHQGRLLDAPRFVADRLWMVEGELYETPSLDEHAGRLPLFDTTLAASDLEVFLSLLASYLPEVPVRIASAELVEGAPRQAQPTLFFEKVDAAQALYLRVAASVPGYLPTLFADYELTHLARVDAPERTVTLSPLAYDVLTEPVDDLRKRLRASARRLKNAEDAAFAEDGNLFIVGPDLAHAFLRDHLTDLIGRYVLYGAERLKAYKVRTVTPRLDLQLDHGIDFLEGSATLTLEGETFSFFDALQRFRRDGYVQLTDGTQAIVDRAYLNRLERLFKKKQDRVQLSFFDLPLVEDLIEERLAEARLPEARAVFRGFNRLHEEDVPLPPVEATLRPYQVYGYKWLSYLRRHGLGGCLADEMGLGKTLQAITILLDTYTGEAPPEAPSLVVLPRSLLFNWARELDRFAPQLVHHTYYGTDRDLAAALEAQIVLTTYDLVRNDAEAFHDVAFHYVVLDESQRIKNLESQTSKAVLLLQARHRLALSGTPVQNNLGELYALFRFLNPAMFGTPAAFARDYAQPIQRDGDADVAHELRRKIYPFVLRRLKRDVAKDLPPRIDQTLYVDLTPEQQRLYEERRRFYREAVHQRITEEGMPRAQLFILQALNELRQIATVPEALTEGRVRSAKREILLEQVLDAAANGRKALVFVNYLNAVETLGDDLTAAGLPYVAMTGATRDRQQLVEQFQEDPDVHVFLMTLKTGGLGLNLTAADTVFLYDPWWNQAAEDQAVDRTHRIGQTSTVFAYKLIARDTIEEKILQLQEHKRALFDQVITADRVSFKALDEADIDFMFA